MSDIIKIYVDEEVMEVPAGISVAGAILGHNHDHKAFHHNSMNGEARAPYCLMGVCYECLMEIDGEPNVQSCLVTVKEGMKIKRQNGQKFTFDSQKNPLSSLHKKSETQE